MSTYSDVASSRQGVEGPPGAGTASPDTPFAGSAAAGLPAPPGRATDDGHPVPCCEVELVHRDAVERARARQAADEDVADLADIFQLLASPTRLRILEALAREELCVCDLAAVVEAGQSAVSHHLRQLRQMKLVRYRKEGRMAFYRLADDHVTSLIETGLEHVRE